VSLASSGNPPAASPIHLDILIVDDNSNVTKALAGLMKNAGYSPVACLSGAEALSYVQTTSPAAAVVDIHLPDISGLIVAQKLRDRFGPSIPIIVVSGDTSMETLNSLSHVGATYFFSKPISAQMLLQHLRELLPTS